MVRTARRSRYSIIRILYGGFLCFILCYMLMILVVNQGMGQELRPRDTAVLSEVFFVTFMLVQITLVVVLTPAYVAGAIADEKDRKTMEFLLATDLLSREIILSKLVSRLANLTLLLLTGLPVLSILQLIGGVDPELMLAGFAGVGLTMLGIASVSILMSTLFKKPRDAISLTYLMLLTYVCLTSFALAFQNTPALSVKIWFEGNAPRVSHLVVALGGIALVVAAMFVPILLLRKRIYAAIMLLCVLPIATLLLGCFGALTHFLSLLDTPLWQGREPPTIGSAILLLNAGNPITAIVDVVRAINGINRAGARSNLATELPGILSSYAWFHFTLAGICILWSIARVRPIALKQSAAGTTASLFWWEYFRPRVGPFPMIWKEFFIDGRTKVNWLVWLAAGILVLLSVGSGLWIVGAIIHEHVKFEVPFNRFFSEVRMPMNIWFRVAGTCVGCVTLLMIGVRAATCITSERERDTFDALVATPMSAQGILFGKLIGCVFSLRPAWIWAGSMILLALVTTGLHPLAVPMLIAAWFIYALFVAMLGMIFSLFIKSSIWSSLFTVLSTLLLGGAHWIITSCCCTSLFSLLMLALRANENQGVGRALITFGEYFIKFQCSVTPPFVFVVYSATWEDPVLGERFFLEVAVMSILAFFLWMLACAIMWFGILVPQFKHIARRNELEYS
jgi:ABC-type transport system involved in multi-copper enzyme maturation permease subunit